MPGMRSVTTTLVGTFALSIMACTSLDVSDYCRYPENISLRDADPGALALVLGIGRGSARDTPFVVIRSSAEGNRGAAVKLRATPAAHPLPADLDESHCARVDWSTYTLTADAEDWDAFWRDDGNRSFEVFIAFLDGNEQLLMSEFGAAIVDTTAAKHLVACGCYWQ
jgi:hypothetical protein